MAMQIADTAEGRLQSYFAAIGDELQEKRQRASFAAYALGILGDGDRKSVEPIAARSALEPVAARRAHERLLHFLKRSRWDDRAVRLCVELGVTVVAEGVETTAEREMLTELGCDVLQGYLFAKPGPGFPAPRW